VVVPVEEPVVVDEPEAVPGSELRAGVDVRSPRGAAEPPVELPPCTKPRPSSGDVDITSLHSNSAT
jgi:hypothetical protein